MDSQVVLDSLAVQVSMDLLVAVALLGLLAVQVLWGQVDLLGPLAVMDQLAVQVLWGQVDLLAAVDLLGPLAVMDQLAVVALLGQSALLALEDLQVVLVLTAVMGLTGHLAIMVAQVLWDQPDLLDHWAIPVVAVPAGLL
jgi:hypothetical protein